jgi:hypothetical protein
MAEVSWPELDEELARWRGAGQAADFWWRDDDATEPTAALQRLLAMSQNTDVPLALAVIPLRAVPELFKELKAAVLMHGTDHKNRGGPGEKKTEFAAAESEAEAIERLAAARERLARQAGARFLPVLAPPWNRLKRSLAARLSGAGLSGLSGYGARSAAEAAPGLRQVNTHVDIVDWHGTRGFIGQEAALHLAIRHLAARRSGGADAGEPTGWLTHHAVHDAAAWDFLERLFERTRGRGARWLHAGALFPSPA